MLQAENMPLFGTRLANVRIIKIEHGECDQIRLLRYHDMYDSLKVDSLLCTDYEFAIDSIFND